MGGAKGDAIAAGPHDSGPAKVVRCKGGVVEFVGTGKKGGGGDNGVTDPFGQKQYLLVGKPRSEYVLGGAGEWRIVCDQSIACGMESKLRYKSVTIASGFSLEGQTKLRKLM